MSGARETLATRGRALLADDNAYSDDDIVELLATREIMRHEDKAPAPAFTQPAPAFTLPPPPPPPVQPKAYPTQQPGSARDRVLRALVGAEDPLSRPQLVALTGLSAPGVDKALVKLIADGVAFRGGPDKSPHLRFAVTQEAADAAARAASKAR